MKPRLLVGAGVVVVGGIGALVALSPSEPPALVVAALVGEASPRDQAVREGLRLAKEALNAEPNAPQLGLNLLDPHANAHAAQDHLRGLESRLVRRPFAEFLGTTGRRRRGPEETLAAAARARVGVRRQDDQLGVSRDFGEPRPAPYLRRTFTDQSVASFDQEAVQ